MINSVLTGIGLGIGLGLSALLTLGIGLAMVKLNDRRYENSVLDRSVK